MAKNSKKQRLVKDVRSESQLKFSAPDVVNIDTLGVFSDDDLSERAHMLNVERYKVMNEGGDPTLWEIELCYTQREFQLRRTRKEHHDSYMSDQVKYQSEDESSLPLPEFDNLRYAVN